MQKDILQTFGKHMKMIIFKCLPEKKVKYLSMGKHRQTLKKHSLNKLYRGVTTIFKDYPVSIT